MEARVRRWVTNLSLFGLEQMLALALAGVWAGAAASAAGLSPFARWMDAWPVAATLAVGVVVLDAAAYASHRLSHRVELLWRLHAVHHADDVLDVSTTVRHHPLETLPTGIAIGTCAWLLGLTLAHISAYAALALTVQSLAHANLRVPERAMRYAGLILVTPALHEVHHSTRPAETNSNYGQVLSLWDRLFGTLLDRPDRQPVTVGLESYRSTRFDGLLGALTLPFRRADASSGAVSVDEAQVVPR